jgi:uncharacterized protein (DUF58 family)
VPTRRGASLISVSFLLYGLARSLSVSELYAVAGAALILPLVSILAVRLGRYRLTITRTIAPRRAFAGAPMRVELEVTNAGRLPTPPLMLEDEAPGAVGGPMRVALTALPPRRVERLVAQRTPSRRGRFEVGPLHARLTDPFGLAHASTEAATPMPVVIYPDVERLSGESPGDRSDAGRSTYARLAPAGDEFHAIRQWQHGDDLRKIHWRSVARTGDMMIRQNETRFFPRVTIFLDTRSSSHRGAGTNSSLEWAVSAAASVVWDVAHRGYVVRLATPDSGPGPSRPGNNRWEPILEELATVTATPARPLQPVFRRLGARPGAGGALLIIVTGPRPEIVAELARVRRSYAWCGAVLLDADSFAEAAARQRAASDQRLAEATQALLRSGWRVAVAGSSDRFQEIWRRLLGIGEHRLSSPLPLS